MTPLVHLIASLSICFMVSPGPRRSKVFFALAVLAGMASDADHLFKPGSLHSLWLLFSLPVLLFGVAALYAMFNPEKGFAAKSGAMLVMLCAVSHLVLDSADGSPLMLFYPMSTELSVLSPALGIESPAVLAMSSAEAIVSAFIAVVLGAKVYMQNSYDRLAEAAFDRTGMVDTLWRESPFEVGRDAGGARATRAPGF